MNLVDPYNQAPSVVSDYANLVNELGVSNLNKGTFSKIQTLSDQFVEVTHQYIHTDRFQAERVIEDFNSINSLVQRFLGTKIGRYIDRQATLFDLPLGKANLSQGQKIILQLCVALHSQAKGLDDVIILMDEPENHLHPAAMLELIESIQANHKNGQLWIATHSLPLLAHFKSSEIWWMENGTISNAGRNPQIVLEGLLGDEGRRAKLAGFLDLPFVVASNRFTAECFLLPETVGAREGDPQTAQIREAVEKLCESKAKFRILDYGAGKGRLAIELAEKSSTELKAKIDYIAYDPDGKDKDECGAAITRLHSTAEKRFFDDLSTLKNDRDEGTFDVVVMCNVLHEIPVSDWGKLFGPGRKITKLLSSDGYLLLVEVQQLPYGELAHQHGFIVLDTAQIRKLFSFSEDEQRASVKIDNQRDGWLKAHLIPKAFIARYTGDTRKESIKDLSEQAFDQIELLRKSDQKDSLNGRRHGFWVQQFANAQLALRELG